MKIITTNGGGGNWSTTEPSGRIRKFLLWHNQNLSLPPPPLPPRFNPRWWMMTGAQEGLHETSVDFLYAAKIKSVKGVLCWIKVKVLLASTWDRGPPQLRGIYKIHSFGNFFKVFAAEGAPEKKSIWFVALAKKNGSKEDIGNLTKVGYHGWKLTNFWNSIGKKVFRYSKTYN